MPRSRREHDEPREDLIWNPILFYFLPVGVTGATSCPVEVMEQVISKLKVTQLTVKLI